MLDFMQYDYIRMGYFKYGKSIRQLEKETGHCRKTIRKVIKGIYPEYKLTKERPCPVLGDFKEIINDWLKNDQGVHKKQRHTGVRIYERLRDEHGYTGSESALRRYVGQLKRELGLSRREVFVPLEQVFGESEVDWGEARVIISGIEKKVKIFAIRAQGSGAIFVKAYPSENLESFLDGHINSFTFFGGVFKVIRYDNLKAAVEKILKGKDRKEQEKFRNFHQYYSYQAVFCNPAKGNEKGGVEGIIGYSRRNFLVPIPEVKDFEELNDMLLTKCIKYQQKKPGERILTVQELLIEEQKHLIPLPNDSFPCWKLRAVKADHYATVRFESNRYSVPTDYGYRDLELRASAYTITIFDKSKLVAEHIRSYDTEQWVLEPNHYLKLLSRKPGAFERAKPVITIKENWPEVYKELLDNLNYKHEEREAKKQFIEILLLHKKYEQSELQSAIEIVLETGGVSYEVINQFLDWAYHTNKKTETLFFESSSPLAKIELPKPIIAHYELLMNEEWGDDYESTN